MKKLWESLDEATAPPSNGARDLLIGALIAVAGIVASLTAKALIGVNLPFVFALCTIVAATGLAGIAGGAIAGLAHLPFLVNAPVQNSSLTATFAMFAGMTALIVLIGGRLREQRTAHLTFTSRLVQREAYLQSIYDNLPAVVLVIDRAGEVLSMNAAGSDLFGLPPGSGAGRPLTDFISLSDHDQTGSNLLHRLDELASQPSGHGLSALGHTADGAMLRLRLGAASVPESRRGLLTIYVRDYTRELAAAAKLEDAQQQLAHMARRTALGEMATAIAHELNQPLAAAANYVQLATIQSDRPAGEAGELKATIGQAGDQIFRAAEVLSRLRGFVGRRAKLCEPLEVRHVVEETCAISQFAARDAGARIDLALAADVDTVFSDRVQFQQVLLNMVRNALEAVADMPVRRVTIRSERSAMGQVKITVSDTGPGVQAETARRLFESFETTKSDGLGVGLSISRTIVEAHGGRIGFDRNPSGGADFWFTLPEQAELDAAA